MIEEMEKVKKYGKMAIFIRVNGKWIKKKDLVAFFGKMVINMKGNGKKIILLE